ncbi:hypothetical protein A6F55_15560 [Prescottella equi]|nr:hypothetical protein A6F55_15560 [Prescottella equi]
MRSLSRRFEFSSLFSPSAVRAIVRAVREADVVHVSVAREFIPVLGALVAVIGRKRLVLQAHGMISGRPVFFFRPVDWLLRFCFRRASKIVVLTRFELDDLTEWFGDEIDNFVVLGNPLPEVSLAEFDHDSTASEEDDARVVFAARLHPRKRVLDFADAASVARENGWAERYLVFGPDHGDLSELMEHSAMGSQLQYCGSVSPDTLVEKVRKADVFVLCSDNEPWGNVLATAIALEVPVVVTKSSALAGDIEHYGAGIVIDDRSPTALAQAVHSIVSDVERAESIRNGCVRMREGMLGRPVQEEALLGLYRSALTVRPGNG